MEEYNIIILRSYDGMLRAIDREVDITELQLTINRLFALVRRDSTLDSAYSTVLPCVLQNSVLQIFRSLIIRS